MPLVTVTPKYQVTIPTLGRKQAGLGVDDLLEAKVKGGRIALTPNSLIDRELASPSTTLAGAARMAHSTRSTRSCGPWRQESTK